jgi:hypothetical protein
MMTFAGEVDHWNWLYIHRWYYNIQWYAKKVYNCQAKNTCTANPPSYHFQNNIQFSSPILWVLNPIQDIKCDTSFFTMQNVWQPKCSFKAWGSHANVLNTISNPLITKYFLQNISIYNSTNIFQFNEIESNIPQQK